MSSVVQHKRKHVGDNDDNKNRTYPSWLDWRLKGFVTDVSHLHNNPLSTFIIVPGDIVLVCSHNQKHKDKSVALNVWHVFVSSWN